MWDFNQVIFQGRVTEDVKLKETPNGKKYCWFTVANNAPKKNQDGSYGEYANFFNLMIFEDYAVRNQQKLFKGRRVMIVGKLIQNKWIDTNGGKHDELKIKVDRMIFDPLTREEKNKRGLMPANESGQQMNVPEENPLETSEAIPVYETKDFEENVSAFANDFGFGDIF